VGEGKGALREKKSKSREIIRESDEREEEYILEENYHFHLLQDRACLNPGIDLRRETITQALLR